MAECISDPLLPQIPWKCVLYPASRAHGAETSPPQHLLEKRATRRELFEDPHYGPIFPREVVPRAQIGAVNPQGFSPTHPQRCSQWMSWACSHLLKRVAPSSMLGHWKAADLGKPAPFLLFVEHNLLQPAKCSGEIFILYRLYSTFQTP